MINPSCFHPDYCCELHLQFLHLTLVIHHVSLLVTVSFQSLLFWLISFASFPHCHSRALPLHSSGFTPPLSPPHVSQYFDEERDDYEYPYYYEGTTSVPPSPSKPPSVPAQTLTEQVKRESDNGGNQKREEKKEAAWVMGKKKLCFLKEITWVKSNIFRVIFNFFFSFYHKNTWTSLLTFLKCLFF